jgi:hypothetical protein
MLGRVCREKDAQELFTQRARQVDFFKYEKGRSGKGDEEGAEARTREAQKKREERMRLEATRRDAIFARMRSAPLPFPRHTHDTHDAHDTRTHAHAHARHTRARTRAPG